MTRVTCIVFQFPQLSESYAATEFAALSAHYALDLISLREPDVRGSDGLPCQLLEGTDAVLDRVREFRPDVLHTHWLGSQLDTVTEVARRTGTPFTVRSHSFDVLWRRPTGRGLRRFFPPPDVSGDIAAHLDVLRSELCLGVLCFPFAVPRLVRAGIPEEKLVPAWPVCDFARFHDESPNGARIYNGGACLPKKDFDAYIRLAATVPDRDFDLYPIGYQAESLEATNASLGGPVRVREPVPHKDMPALFKQYEWLVYTADAEVGTVGWPVSVAEAQAAGVGICLPNLRPDIADYVGPAGFVYDTMDEVRDILSRPYPESMRRAGFAHARRSDVHAGLSRLTDLWRPVSTG